MLETGMGTLRPLLLLSGLVLVSNLAAREYPELPTKPTRGDKMLAAYFKAEVEKLEDWNQERISSTPEEWPADAADRRP